jgi:hypothetical protein
MGVGLAEPTLQMGNCLTAEEELKIVNEFCERAVALGNHYSFPLNVVVCLTTLLVLFIRLQHYILGYI